MKQNIRQVGGGGGSGRAGGKGKPGYPVPQAMLPDDNAVFEDLVTHVILGLNPKTPVDEFVEAAENVGLAVKAIPLDGMLGEAETPEQLHKGIEHLDELKPADFMAFLEKYKDLPLKGGLEVSEKVDGSARISFGMQDDNVWTQSKNGSKKMSPDQYGDKPMFRAIKTAHQALQNSAPAIRAWWPKDVGFMVAEVLYTKIPNSIEYGPNVVMVHGVHKKDGSVVSDSEAKKIVDVMSKAVGKRLHDGKEDWMFEYKRVINPKDVMVDVKKEYTSLKQIHDELKKLEPDKLKAAGKGPYKASLAKFQAVQGALKKKLLGQLRKQRSAYGPKDGDIEGIVFRDLDSGALTKLVDKDYFTKLNKFLWHYRELLDRGVKVGENWEAGVMQKLRNGIADNVFGLPVAKTPSFVGQLVKFGNSLDIPPEIKSPEQRTDYVLSKYIESNGLMKGAYFAGFKKELNDAWRGFKALRKDWDTKKKIPMVHSVKDDEGNLVKKVKMDPLIKGRTDETFVSMEDTLSSIGQALDEIGGLSDEQTKKTGMLKVFLGAARLEKLQGQLGGKVQESAPLPNNSMKMYQQRGEASQNFLTQFVDKLRSRGVELPKKPHHLGSGTQASAFDLEDGRVLKVTADVKDAQACLKLKGLKLKHVAAVHDVFAFPGDKKKYGIVMEKLDSIPGVGPSPMSSTGEAKVLNDAVHQTFLDQALDAPKKDWEEALKMMIHLLKVRKTELGTEAAKKFQDNFVLGLEVLKKYQIPAMIGELSSHGIGFNDFHAGNIMKRSNGSYALVDLGHSDVTGGGVPPMLEKKMNEELANSELYRDIVSRHAQELAKRHVKIGKELASGANGMVFDIGSGKILKVTIDEDEALASNHIKGKNLKHVVTIHDVFKFKTDPDEEGDFFGIVEEKLAPLSQGEVDEIEASMGAMDKMAGIGWVGAAWRAELKKAQARVVDKAKFKATFDSLNKHGVFAVLDDLANNDVDWFDLSPDNLMKKNGQTAAVDLGTSDSPGKMPSTIESTVREATSALFREAKADKVGVTIGRFQPFHKGHAQMIRDLARKFNKVIVIVAGNSEDKKNPFSYDTRLDLMKKSLPDVMSKLEIYKAEFGGKGSGYIPGILSDIVKNQKSSVDADTGITILVGADRHPEIMKQIEHARGLIANGTDLKFNPDLAVVEQLPDVKNDDDVDRVSGTRVREALAADDKEEVKKLLDPHVISNPADFEELYVRLKKELAGNTKLTPKKSKLGEIVEEVVMTELLSSVGGVKGIEQIMQANSEKLKNSTHSIDTQNLHMLGNGKEGVAYDIGNGKVLKVTTDKDEAMTSQGLKGKVNLKHVVHVFDVFRFGETPGTTESVYGIVTEKLTPLSSTEAKEYDKAIDDIDVQMGGKNFINARWEGDYDEMLKQMRALFSDDITKEGGLKPGDPKIQRIVEIRMKEYVEFFKKYKMKEMMSELKSLGIKFADYHGGNVMKRGSDYVINDLGRSESPSNKEPAQLENVINTVVEGIMTELSISGPGGTAYGMKAGSSAWSASMNPVDPGSKELWQNSLLSLQLPGTGSIDADISGDSVV